MSFAHPVVSLSLITASTLELRNNRVYLNRLGKLSLWATPFRPTVFIEANQTYVVSQYPCSRVTFVFPRSRSEFSECFA